MNKRFRIDDDGIVTDMLDLSMYIDNEDCCEKLNDLYEENQQLENEIARLQLIIKKHENQDYANYIEKIRLLSEENNDLKKQLKF